MGIESTSEMVNFGESALQATIKDVTEWNRIGAWAKLARIIDHASRVAMGSPIRTIDTVVESAIKDGFMPELLDNPSLLGRHETDKIVQAALARSALDYARRLERGRGLGLEGLKFRLTVLEPGLMVETDRLASYRRRSIKHSSIAAIGTTFEGKAVQMRSDPEYGGMLEVERRLGKQILTGLVNVATLQPRVDLEVFGNGGVPMMTLKHENAI